MDLDTIYDRIQTFEVNSAYPSSGCTPAGDDIRGVLDILADLVDELRSLEAANKRTADTASCLANGIKPD